MLVKLLTHVCVTRPQWINMCTERSSSSWWIKVVLLPNWCQAIQQPPCWLDYLIKMSQEFYYVTYAWPFNHLRERSGGRRPILFGFNTLRPRQNGCHSPDDNLKRISLNENVWVFIAISLKFVPRGPINNIPALVQIMAWCRSSDKP